jgi:hypothetical protein
MVSKMGDKRKTQHEFIRQAIKEAVERMKPELHAASEAAHQLEEAEAEEDANFQRTVELGYVVDVLANLCGPNLAVVYEVACALYDAHENKSGRNKRSGMSRSGIDATILRATGASCKLARALS